MMSSFTVTNRHINALVRYASYHRLMGIVDAKILQVRGNEQQYAQWLLDENIKSVNYRYNDRESGHIEYNRGEPVLSAIQAIKASQCLRYQSCEHPTFDGSIAEKLIETIIADAIPRLDGYESADWAIAEVTA